MGEYATYKGDEVKIGTCEDMYYLRADQAHLVRPINGNVDPIADRGEIRFRFPWPDEDEVEPGGFDDPFRTLRVYGEGHPEGLPHDRVQFIATAGYNVMLPCPEGPVDPLAPYTIHRNGWNGGVHIVQQRYFGGHLVTIAECGSCRTKYRLQTWDEAESIVLAIRAMADREQRTANQNDTPGNAVAAQRLHLIADRITAGYLVNTDADLQTTP